MNRKKVREIICKNKSCKKYMCHTDGTFIFVDGVNILPELKDYKKSSPKKNCRMNLICSECGTANELWLSKIQQNQTPEPKPGRKFLIFRSRF